MDGERAFRTLIGTGVVACIALFVVGFAAPILPPGTVAFLHRGTGPADAGPAPTPADTAERGPAPTATATTVAPATETAGTPAPSLTV